MKSQKKIPESKDASKPPCNKGSSKKVALRSNNLAEKIANGLQQNKRHKLTFRAQWKSEKNFSPLFLYLFQGRQLKSKAYIKTASLQGRASIYCL